MHKFMRAIGFSGLTDRREQQKLITDIILNASHRSYTSNGEETILAEFCEDFAKDMGIAVCGEFDESDKFTYDYFYPYLRGTGISSCEDVSVERHADKESYAGVCDDIKVGVSLIFYLQNMVPYVKAQYENILPIRGTTLTLSGLSLKGNIILPISKNDKQKQKVQKASRNRNQLIDAARRGDEDAIESLTLEDMDTYTAISKKILTEDVFSLVDTYFMPYGVECDQYSIMGEILDISLRVNKITKEEVYVMRLSCNDLQFDVCINKKDLYGEPQVGRRFKGIIWLQGYINYPAM
ncbi:MAG: DUF3881 family protein [Lachnospiraceae bacterium]|nr:DUF3881 family protein [Lachnospiraceae bacterium]MBD5504193.1 DUF3881 family protein [Lachnospiraceae bacterium]